MVQFKHMFQDALQDAGLSYNTESNVFIWNCDNISPQYTLVLIIHNIIMVQY